MLLGNVAFGISQRRCPSGGRPGRPRRRCRIPEPVPAVVDEVLVGTPAAGPSQMLKSSSAGGAFVGLVPMLPRVLPPGAAVLVAQPWRTRAASRACRSSRCREVGPLLRTAALAVLDDGGRRFWPSPPRSGLRGCCASTASRRTRPCPLRTPRWS